MPVYTLAYYQQQTQELLQNPSAPASLYPIATINDAINKARLWIAGEGQCILNYANISLASGVQNFSFGSIVTLGTPVGIAGVLNVRMMAYTFPGGGQRMIYPRSWPYFFSYELNQLQTLPVQGTIYPTTWSQLNQGTTGTVWVSPIPNTALVYNMDVACFPIDLVGDPTETEAIPPPWTQCVPFLAAWYALMSAQSGNRAGDADRMMKLYQEFADRARSMVTSPVNKYLYRQTVDPTEANQLALSGGKQ